MPPQSVPTTILSSISKTNTKLSNVKTPFPQNQNLISNLKSFKYSPYYIHIPLTNYFDVQYYGPLYLGTQKSKLNVIYDTGSNLLWVPSVNCTTCRSHTTKYDPFKSKNAKFTNETKNIIYALGNVNGRVIEDLITINKEEMSIDSFRILLAEKENDLNGTIADGVLGLGIDIENNTRNSLIYSLYENNSITSPSFSIYLTDSKTDSRLFIGDIKENKYIYNLLKNIGIEKCQVPLNALYWQCPLYEIGFEDDNNFTKLNETTYSKVYYRSLSNIIFDSGTSFIVIPNNDYKIINSYLSSRLRQGQKCVLSEFAQVQCQCDSPFQFGKMKLYFDENTTFEVVFEDIISYFPSLEYQCQIQILVEPMFEYTWIVGDSALRESLMTFNMKERSIQWVQLRKKLDEDEMLKSKNKHPNAIYYTWAIAGVAFLIILSFLAYCFMR